MCVVMIAELMCPSGIATTVFVAAAHYAENALVVVLAARSHTVQAVFSHAPSAIGIFAVVA